MKDLEKKKIVHKYVYQQNVKRFSPSSSITSLRILQTYLRILYILAALFETLERSTRTWHTVCRYTDKLSRTVLNKRRAVETHTQFVLCYMPHVKTAIFVNDHLVYAAIEKNFISGEGEDSRPLFSNL